MLQASMLSERQKVSISILILFRHLLQEIKRKASTIAGQVSVRTECVSSQQISTIDDMRFQPSYEAVSCKTIPINGNNGPLSVLMPESTPNPGGFIEHEVPDKIMPHIEKDKKIIDDLSL